MTQNERFDAVFARIEKAKAHPAFQSTLPTYSLRVRLAGKILELGNLESAENAISAAEKILLDYEIRQLAKDLRGRDLAKVYLCLSKGDYDGAMALVLV